MHTCAMGDDGEEQAAVGPVHSTAGSMHATNVMSLGLGEGSPAAPLGLQPTCTSPGHWLAAVTLGTGFSGFEWSVKAMDRGLAVVAWLKQSSSWGC